MANLAIQFAVGVAGQLLFSLFAPKPPDVEGPRLDDLSVPSVAPGNPITRSWGTMKVPAQVIFHSGLNETRHEKRVKGGKGGGKSQKQITYTYSATFAMAVKDGPGQIMRIFANEKLLWERPGGETLSQAEKDAARAAYLAERTDYWNNYPFWPKNDDNENRSYVSRMIQVDIQQDMAVYDRENSTDDEFPEYGSLKVYDGTESQMPDPTLEALLGVGEVPAYRGVTYFVVEELELADFGNSTPTIKVEVRDREGEVSIRDIIVDVCTDAGLTLDDHFAVEEALTPMTINGFALTRLTSARDAVQLLDKVFPIDARESGDQVTFFTKDRDPIAAILWDDMRARGSTDNEGDKLVRSRTDDLQLPRRISVSYQDFNRDYSKNTAVAQRQFSQSNLVESRDLPVSTTPQRMKKAVGSMMASIITERTEFKFTVPTKYVALKPGDVVFVPTSPTEYRQARITQMDLGADFLIEMRLVDQVPTEASIAAIADTRVSDPIVRVPFALTDGYILDCPSLDDTQLETGAYVAMAPSTPNWTGAAVFRDIISAGSTVVFGEVVDTDDGTQWEQEVTAQGYSPVGVLAALLPAPDILETIDRANDLVVVFQTPAPQFSSLTFNQAVSGNANTFMVGDEIIQALTVLPASPNSFVFSDLLRGQRGTEWAVHDHALDERVVTLESTTLERWPLDDDQIDQTVEYRIVGDGLDVLGQPTQTLAFTAAHRTAFAPSIIGISREPDGELTVDIDPRVRFGGALVNGSAPVLTDLDEYTIEVHDGPAEAGGTTVVRTSTLVASRAFVYTAAEQVSDFGTTQAVVHLLIRQTSSDGRPGFPRYASV